MSATYQITSAQITGFIASNLSQLEEFLAADLELFYKESAPEHFDYEYCRNALRRHLERQDSQLQGLCLLFLHHPEICKEIHAAMDALKQLYQSRFLEVMALEFPKQQNSADQSSLPSLSVPPQTLENSALDIVNSSDSALKTQPQKLPSVTPTMINALRYYFAKSTGSAFYFTPGILTDRTIDALYRRGLIVRGGSGEWVPSNTGLSIIDIDDNAIGDYQ